jgi:hypothetical protein
MKNFPSFVTILDNGLKGNQLCSLTEQEMIGVTMILASENGKEETEEHNHHPNADAGHN